MEESQLQRALRPSIKNFEVFNYFQVDNIPGQKNYFFMTSTS